MKTLYLRHRDGATRALAGRRFTQLLKALRDDRGGPELTALAEEGYEGFLGPDGTVWSLDSLTADVMSTP